MSRKYTRVVHPTTDCLNCHSESWLTAWRGRAGIDQDLREYLCPCCGRKVYINIKGSRLADLEGIILQRDRVEMARNE